MCVLGSRRWLKISPWRICNCCGFISAGTCSVWTHPYHGVWSSPTMLSDPGDRSPAVTSRSIPPRLEQPRPSPAVSSRLQPSPAVSSDQSAKLTLFWAEISHAHGKKCPPERDCCSRWLPIPWGSSLDDVCDAPASQIPAGSAYPTSVHDRYEVTIDRYMVVT